MNMLKGRFFQGRFEKAVRLGFLACIVGIWIQGSQEQISWAAGVIKIGVLEEPKTLNVWRATDTWSRRVLGQIYQPLLVREPKDLQLVPWLAAELPAYDSSNLTYTVKLRPAKWSDGSDLTAEDVAFTGQVIREFKIPRAYSRPRFAL